MTTLTLDRHNGRAITYDVVRPGLNYRIDEMRAALGLVQLYKLESANRRRQELVECYIGLLDGVEGVTIPFIPLSPDVKPTYHIFPILLGEAR